MDQIHNIFPQVADGTFVTLIGIVAPTALRDLAVDNVKAADLPGLLKSDSDRSCRVIFIILVEKYAKEESGKVCPCSGIVAGTINGNWDVVCGSVLHRSRRQVFRIR